MGWVCSTIGAREHYTVPLAFHRVGALARFYTDAWAGPLAHVAGFGPSSFRAFAGRFHPALPAGRVVAFHGHSLRRRVSRVLTQRQARSVEARYLEFIQDGSDFATRVCSHVAGDWDRLRPAGFFGYNTGSLETIRLFRERGRPAVVDQIDAGRVHEDVVLQEEQKWPGWQSASGRVPEEYWRRLGAEWNEADRVVVNSNWTRRALVAQGVAEDRIRVIPLAYTPPPTLPPRRRGRGLTVLFLGRVVLEKGIPYLFEAARLLAGSPVRFLVAGPVGLSSDALASAPPNVTILGRVTRDRIGGLYASADVFVLPTMSDGFAITQLEAMARGLPVIATQNCGDVVTDGRDGRLVPAGDATAIAACVAELVDDRALLEGLSRGAREALSRFSQERLDERVLALIGELGAAPQR